MVTRKKRFSKVLLNLPLRCSPAPPSHQYPSANVPLKPTFLTLTINIKFPSRLQDITEYFSFAVIMLKHWHIFFDFSHIADLLLLLSILFHLAPLQCTSTLATFRFPVTLTTGSWLERKQSMDLYISINQILFSKLRICPSWRQMRNIRSRRDCWI